MKDRLIKNVVEKMSYLPTDDIEQLKNVLAIVLNEFDVQAKKNEIVEWNMDDNYKLIGMFLMAKKVQGCTQRTLDYYKMVSMKFIDQIQLPLSEINTEHIRFFIANRDMKDHVSKCTQNNERRVLSSLFGWLHREEYIGKNPMLRIEGIKQVKEKKVAFTDMEIEKMRSSLDAEIDKAIFEILLSTGCRVSELCNIRIDDIHGDQILVHGKGQKDRNVYLNAKASIAIDAYIGKRNDKNPFLFPRRKPLSKKNTKGVPHHRLSRWYEDEENIDITKSMGAGTIEQKVRNLGRMHGIKSHPHKFRRTCATNALRRGMPLLTVSKMLGHESIGTTQIYLDIDESEVRDAHKKFVV